MVMIKEIRKADVRSTTTLIPLEQRSKAELEKILLDVKPDAFRSAFWNKRVGARRRRRQRGDFRSGA